jgi:hypothetical protein
MNVSGGKALLKRIWGRFPQRFDVYFDPIDQGRKYVHYGESYRAFPETAKLILQLRRVDRDGNVLAHELALTLEDESVRLRRHRQLASPTNEELVSLAQSRRLAGLVGYCDLACALALSEHVRLLLHSRWGVSPSSTMPASSKSYLGGDAAGPFSIRKYAAVRGFLMPSLSWLPKISA